MRITIVNGSGADSVVCRAGAVVPDPDGWLFMLLLRKHLRDLRIYSLTRLAALIMEKSQ